MIELELRCSAAPGRAAFSCVNAAEVRLVNRTAWRRPLCLECAVAFEERCALEGLRAPLFVELEPR